MATRRNPPAAPATRALDQWLALGMLVGPVLFTLGAFALAPLHPGYSIVSDQMSALAVGPNGALMRSLFLLYGVLVSVGVVVLFHAQRHQLGAMVRWTCTALLLLSPLGILWAGICTMDHLALHTVGAQLALGTPVLAFPIVGLLLRRTRTWRRFGTFMILGGPLSLALLIGFTTSVPLSVLSSGAGAGSLGLWQRALAIEVFAWYAAMGWLAFSRRPSGGPSR